MGIYTLGKIESSKHSILAPRQPTQLSLAIDQRHELQLECSMTTLKYR